MNFIILHWFPEVFLVSMVKLIIQFKRTMENSQN